MARKPNYRFERFERDRNKAAKKAARLQAKADRRAAKKGDGGDADALDDAAALDVTVDGTGDQTADVAAATDPDQKTEGD